MLSLGFLLTPSHLILFVVYRSHSRVKIPRVRSRVMFVFLIIVCVRWHIAVTLPISAGGL